MNTIIHGRDKVMALWAATRIPYIKTAKNFGPCHAVGIATGRAPEDLLMAVVVFHGHNAETEVCQVSVAAVDPHWATRRIFRELLAIPFEDMGVNRLWATVPHKQTRTVALLKYIGFTREADLKSHFGRGVHAACFRMLSNEYERRYPAAKPAKDATPMFVDVAMEMT